MLMERSQYGRKERSKVSTLLRVKCLRGETEVQGLAFCRRTLRKDADNTFLSGFRGVPS